MSSENPERFWQSAASKLARRVNLGWWLGRWTGWVLGMALIGSVALLLFRWLPMIELRWVWAGIAGMLLLGAIVAWATVRNRFESCETSRIRLEDALGLKTQLSAASAGIGKWPEMRTIHAWPIRWKWQRPLTVLTFTALMLGVSAWIPISQKPPVKPRVIEKPSAVKDVEAWVEELRKEDATEDKSLEEVEKKISELLQRPSENWYEHGSLEAAGNLKEQTSDMLRELADNLAQAEEASSALQTAGDALPQAAKDALAKELGDAAQGLRAGGIKPNEQLLQQLAQMAGKQGQNLSKEQLQKLSEKLQQNAKALQEALKNSPELKIAAQPNGNGTGKKPGEGPGKGDIKRGPGAAPMTLKPDESNLNGTKTETLVSQLDLERLAPGDALGVTNGQHEVDKSQTISPQPGGAIQNTGDGGAAVWQNTLMPAEREALKRYFK